MGRGYTRERWKMADDQKKPKRGCEVEFQSEEKDINDTGYNEGPAKYIAAKAKCFWEEIRKVFEI